MKKSVLFRSLNCRSIWGNVANTIILFVCGYLLWEIFEVRIRSFVCYRPCLIDICRAAFNGSTDLTTGLPPLDFLHFSVTSFKYPFPTMAPTRITRSATRRPSPIRRSERISRSQNHCDSQSDNLIRKMTSITCFFEQDVKRSRTVSPP